MDEKHKLAISKANKGRIVSPETRLKIGLANRGVWINFNCDYCKKECSEKQSHYNRTVKHFCSRKCQGQFRKGLPRSLQPTYKGVLKDDEPKWKYSARYRKAHPERISHLKALRYSREKSAEGSYTLEDWVALCNKFDNKCAHCKESKKLTRDHIKPLSLGGTNFITNIQPLCRNCNSRKWKNYDIHANPSLLLDIKN